MEDLLRFYGIDWVAMALSLYAVYLLGNRNKWGFVSFIISNALWVYVGYLTGSYAIAIGNFVFLLMNSRGYLKWVREARVSQN
ncbi:MAG: nicotinamide mononucleotide transporter [Bacteroidetes bacterium]|jgi:nicotinamide riboside transporter PnuC|nr:MAG: nicotinamide mononucleotide transporter [Bacteroidota bacterium]